MDNCLFPPYDGFVDWCRNNRLNLLVCGWDNRRKGDWATRFFLDHLPAYVRQRAAAVHRINVGINDPLAKVSLIGHSQGGMLIKWMVNNHEHALCRDMRLAVTVATAFYGAAPQTHRMFEGEPLVGGRLQKGGAREGDSDNARRLSAVLPRPPNI